MKNMDTAVKQALDSALTCAGLSKEECRCVAHAYEDGYDHFVVHTLLQEYEFYVDAASGEVPGISMIPFTDPDVFDYGPARRLAKGSNESRKIA